jgi:crotonobetainyl-CoA:carnitine CoA-transferase CaiB-like acyl-CoA transferase
LQKLPLENIRVIDLTQVRMGPQLTQWLAVMGAEVIKIETNLRQEVSKMQMAKATGEQEAVDSKRVGYFASLNYGKKSITLNMKHPKAVGIVKELVKVSDIVAENFGKAVMEHWGLGYADLKKIKPDIVYYAGSGWGRTGPYSERPAYSPIIDAFTGIAYANSFPGGVPLGLGVRGWNDSISAQHGVFAVLAALYHRSKTGKGQYIDLSMIEVAMSFAPEQALNYAINGKLKGPIGNQDEYMAPHGCYRCKGEDKWVAIAVSNEIEWVAFCEAIGNPDWTKNQEFNNELSRHKNQDKLDKLINDWTINFDHIEIMQKLQKAGVMAGASLNVEEVVNDPHLAERNFFVDIEYPDKTKLRRTGLPWKLSDTSRGNYRYAPSLGEQNNYVFSELLGISNDDIQKLKEEKVIY